MAAMKLQGSLLLLWISKAFGTFGYGSGYGSGYGNGPGRDDGLLSFVAVGEPGWVASDEGATLSAISYSSLSQCEEECSAKDECLHFTACPSLSNVCVLHTGTSMEADMYVGNDCQMYFPALIVLAETGAGTIIAAIVSVTVLCMCGCACAFVFRHRLRVLLKGQAFRSLTQVAPFPTTTWLDEDRIESSWQNPNFPSHWSNNNNDVAPNSRFDQMIYVNEKLRCDFNVVMQDSYEDRVTQDRLCPKKENACARTPGGCPCVQVGGDPGLPEGYVVRCVVRNEDAELWKKYTDKRAAIKAKRQNEQVRLFDPPLMTASWADAHADDVGPLDKDINEGFFWHGTHVRAALSIAQDNFRLSLAGSGAGTMYGAGTYLAESCTKADEYAKDEPGGFYEDIRAMVMCRVTMGKMYYTTRRDEHASDHTLKDETHDSTCGDRTKTAKTFREFVVYDVDQVYPEYVVFYSRRFRADEPAVLEKIARTPLLLQLPVYWRSCHKNPETEEFDIRVKIRERSKKLLQTLIQKSSGKDLHLKEAYRYEDSRLWSKYIQKKQELASHASNIPNVDTTVCDLLQQMDSESMVSTSNLDSSLNEFFLWHGTKKEYSEHISEDGFKIGAARVGRRFGDGVYFAEDLNKSLHYATKEGGIHYVLLCRVLAGKMYTTSEDDTSADEKARQNGCDSVLADVSPREFIIPDCAQVYPEFVLHISNGA